jgi:hypothetical protein
VLLFKHRLNRVPAKVDRDRGHLRPMVKLGLNSPAAGLQRECRRVNRAGRKLANSGASQVIDRVPSQRN